MRGWLGEEQCTWKCYGRYHLAMDSEGPDGENGEGEGGQSASQMESHSYRRPARKLEP
jgi:hypothetical protein